MLLSMGGVFGFRGRGRRSELRERDVDREVQLGVSSLNNQSRGNVAAILQTGEISEHRERARAVIHYVESSAVFAERDALGTLEFGMSTADHAQLGAGENEREGIEIREGSENLDAVIAHVRHEHHIVEEIGVRGDGDLGRVDKSAGGRISGYQTYDRKRERIARRARRIDGYEPGAARRYAGFVNYEQEA